jgi:hypothetical protein
MPPNGICTTGRVLPGDTGQTSTGRNANMGDNDVDLDQFLFRCQGDDYRDVRRAGRLPRNVELALIDTVLSILALYGVPADTRCPRPFRVLGGRYLADLTGERPLCEQPFYRAPSRTRTDTVRILRTAVWVSVTSTITS